MLLAHANMTSLLSVCLGCFALRQFFYPPGGFRTWHTNVWDGLGWRGYIVHVDKDNMSALNVMLGDKLVRCPDKAAIFRYAHSAPNSLTAVRQSFIIHARAGTCRLFKIRDANMPTWHSVISDCNRYSLGFKVPDRVARETLMPRATKTYGVNASGEVEVLERKPSSP
eukprot:COSAG02_NODE_5872_length_3973_cov_1.698245_3_plen_168_part_00